MSGSNSKHGTSADCINCRILPQAYIEIKYRANFLHHSLFFAAAAKAKKEGKTPLLITHEAGQRGELVTLSLVDFFALVAQKEVAG